MFTKDIKSSVPVAAGKKAEPAAAAKPSNNADFKNSLAALLARPKPGA